MQILAKKYMLRFNQTFRIAAGSRNTTETVLLSLSHNKIIAYGQASLPPYLTENAESVLAFIKCVDDKLLEQMDYPHAVAYISQLKENNYAAKAALNMALTDLYAKLHQIPVYKLLNLPCPTCKTAFTISIGNYDETLNEIKKHAPSHLLKIKMGSHFDDEMLRAISEARHPNFFVDVNAGWKSYQEAYDKTNHLYEAGCILIEQPLPVNMIEETALLKETSPLCVVADESVKTSVDVERLKNVFSGINIKLMKCGSFQEAIAMAHLAKKYNMQVLLGSMAESTLAVTATAHLASIAEWHDLDAPLMIQNDPFDGISYTENAVTLPSTSGIGATPNLLFPL
ncbi:MAG: dipeptide epimerase [Vicingaceae bacterium]|nr:dipeptide epimerase [Flavobacteriales bacterium]WKZ74345.1 MAG: dipeptide epimerase [Vicingaceae bacterium]